MAEDANAKPPQALENPAAPTPALTQPLSNSFIPAPLSSRQERRIHDRRMRARRPKRLELSAQQFLSRDRQPQKAD